MDSAPVFTSVAEEDLYWRNVLSSDETEITAQMLSDFEHFRRTQRKRIAFWKQPVRTLQLVLQGAYDLTASSFTYLFSHQVFLGLGLPCLVLWPIALQMPGAHVSIMQQIQFGVLYFTWWVGLGVLSSIGLGSGLQSGMLFLLPHIFRVCLAAETCGHMEFASFGDMWFSTDSALFQCPSHLHVSNPPPVTFMAIWYKIIWPCFLQSTGTALGEIPPYWMARSARLAAIEEQKLRRMYGSDSPAASPLPASRTGLSIRTPRSPKSPFSPRSTWSSSLSETEQSRLSSSDSDNDADSVPAELREPSSYSLVTAAKNAMVYLLRRHGFLGVLFLASYPNVLFDLCGLACGHFLMPFGVFFTATWLGKAVIRNAYQSLLYVLLGHAESRHRAVTYTLSLLPASWRQSTGENSLASWEQVVQTLVTTAAESFRSTSTSSSAQPVHVHAQTGADSQSSLHNSVSSTETTFDWTDRLQQYLPLAGKLLIAGLLAGFVTSCLSELAQSVQRLQDDADLQSLRHRLPADVLGALQSPSSGRLKLPAPTPVVRRRSARLARRQQQMDREQQTDDSHSSRSNTPGTLMLFSGERSREKSSRRTINTDTDDTNSLYHDQSALQSVSPTPKTPTRRRISFGLPALSPPEDLRRGAGGESSGGEDRETPRRRHRRQTAEQR